MMDEALLLALTIATAKVYAENNEWVLDNSSRLIYKTSTGKKVRIIPDSHSLQGLPRHTKVYLGFRWQDRDDAEFIQQNIIAGWFTPVKDWIANFTEANQLKEIPLRSIIRNKGSGEYYRIINMDIHGWPIVSSLVKYTVTNPTEWEVIMEAKYD